MRVRVRVRVRVTLTVMLSPPLLSCMIPPMDSPALRATQTELTSIASFLETARHAGSTLKHGALVSWKK